MAKLPPLSTQVKEARYAYIESNQSRKGLIAISCVGKERCNPDYRMARESFVGYGMEFVSAGRGEVLLNGQSWPLCAGALFCYGPRTHHVITADSRSPMTKFFVDFSGERARAILQRSSLQPGGVIYAIDVEGIESIYEAMINEGNKGFAVSADICTRYFEILLLKTRENTAAQAGRLSYAASTFRRCRGLIDANFLKLRDLNDIAQKVHVTPAYLCRLFRQFGQVGPYQYLTRKKLHRAAELLAGEGYAVKEAAAEVGY